MMKIHYHIILAVVFSLSALDVKAQTEENKSPFTLEECIEYALKNNINIRNSNVDAQIAKAKIGEIRATGLPQINGSVQFSHNEPLRRMFFSSDNPFLQRDGGSQLPPGNVVAVPNLFQLPSSGDATVSINQLIFNGSYIIGLKAAKSYQELATKTTDQTKIQTTEQVSKAYYTVLINNERLDLFQSNIARVDSLLRNTRGLFESGFAEKIDVDRIQVTYNNLLIEMEKFADLVQLSKELLKFQMNYPMDKEIAIVGDASELAVDENINEQIENFEYSNRAEYSILQTQEKLQKLDISNNLVGYLPTISAFANLGYFTQSPTIGGLFRTESDIPDTPQAGPDKWYRYGLFGVTLNIPIFDGLTKSYTTQQAKLNLLKVQNGFEALRSSIDLQVNQSQRSLNNSLKTLNAQKENVALAEEVARVTKIKYREGVGSNLEVTEAEAALKEAQINYFNALYDVVIAQVNLKSALGTIAK